MGIYRDKQIKKYKQTDKNRHEGTDSTRQIGNLIKTSIFVPSSNYPRQYQRV